MSETIKTRALVLNSIRWKESSKIVTLYSRELGKIKVIARGALRNKNAFAGKLETLCLLDVIINQKESRSLQILNEADLFSSFNQMRNNLEAYGFGLAILEIINQVFEDLQADQIFFDFTVEMLETIMIISQPENVLIYFLLKLSSYLGFKPHLDKCISGSTEKCAEIVYLSMTEGHVFCSNCNMVSENPLRLKKEDFFCLKNLQKINHRRLRIWENVPSEPKRLIRILLSYINFHLERELHIDALQFTRNNNEA
jgi:DNA repair protein RecO (recombination protein O)